MAEETFPLVNANNLIKNLFNKIKEIPIPKKFTQDFIHLKLGLKSSSYNAMPLMLKKIGFLDIAGLPTQAYRDYKDSNKSNSVLKNCIKNCYERLDEYSEFPEKLELNDIKEKMALIMNAKKNDEKIKHYAHTYSALIKLVDWDDVEVLPQEHTTSTINIPDNIKKEFSDDGNNRFDFHKIGINYTRCYAY